MDFSMGSWDLGRRDRRTWTDGEIQVKDVQKTATYSLSNLVVTKFTTNGPSSWPSALFHPFDQFEKSHITFLKEFGWGYLDFTIFFET